MPIINREKDVAEQRVEISENIGLLATGVTRCIFLAPYMCEVSISKMSAIGISGTPTAQLSINRFLAGVGVTNISGGFSAVTLQAFGTSGALTVPQLAAGSSNIQLLVGDQLLLVSGGTNAAAADFEIFAAIKCLQDIKSHFGI